MHNCTYNTDIEYEELEDFWCNLIITEEELEEANLDGFELNLDDLIHPESEDIDECKLSVYKMIDFED